PVCPTARSTHDALPIWLILDLRNDPGGLLDAAVEVAGELIDGGVVVTTRGRNGADDHVYRAPATGDLVRGTPIVVLINSASASADRQSTRLNSIHQIIS